MVQYIATIATTKKYKTSSSGGLRKQRSARCESIVLAMARLDFGVEFSNSVLGLGQWTAESMMDNSFCGEALT